MDEGSEILVETARDEPGNLLGGEIVIRAQAGRGRRVLGGARVSEAGLVECGDRRPLPVPALKRVAANLEAAAKWSEFRKQRVARGALLARLPRVSRERGRGSGSEKERCDRDGEERECERPAQGVGLVKRSGGFLGPQTTPAVRRDRAVDELAGAGGGEMGAVVAVPTIVWGHLVVHRVLRHFRSSASAFYGDKRGCYEGRSDKSATIDAALLTVFTHVLPRDKEFLAPLKSIEAPFALSS